MGPRVDQCGVIISWKQGFVKMCVLNYSRMNTEELFDVTDANNQLTGKTISRVEAHRSGAWHRTVHIYCVREDAGGWSFLVHLRSKTKDLHPNCWDTRFGGHVRAGETIEQTVIDEMKEEIGIQVDMADMLTGPIKKSASYSNREFNYVFFYTGIKNENKLAFKDDEVQEVKWMHTEEIINSMKERPEIWTGALGNFIEIANWVEEQIF